MHVCMSLFIFINVATKLTKKRQNKNKENIYNKQNHAGTEINRLSSDNKELDFCILFFHSRFILEDKFMLTADVDSFLIVKFMVNSFKFRKIKKHKYSTEQQIKDR